MDHCHHPGRRSTHSLGARARPSKWLPKPPMAARPSPSPAVSGPHVVVLDHHDAEILNGIEGRPPDRRDSARHPDRHPHRFRADEAYLLSALEKPGARGYVLKSSAESEVVDAVARGDVPGKAFFQSEGEPYSLADDYNNPLTCSASRPPDAYELLNQPGERENPPTAGPKARRIRKSPTPLDLSSDHV